MKKVLAMSLVGLASCGATHKEAAEPKSQWECGYEDVLAFELKEDAFDLPKGYTVCLHIDQAHDQPTPENPEGFER